MLSLQGNLKADPTDRSGMGGRIGMARTGTFGVFGDANCGVSTIGERAEIEFEAMAVLDGALLAAADGLSTTLVSDGGWPGLSSRRRYVTATHQPRENELQGIIQIPDAPRDRALAGGGSSAGDWSGRVTFAWIHMRARAYSSLLSFAAPPSAVQAREAGCRASATRS